MSKNSLTQEQCQELIQLLSKRKDKLEGRITKNNSLTQEQLEELVKRLSKRKNELHGRIPITAVMDILTDLELSDLLIENDIDEVCEPMDRESKTQTWQNSFKFALILIIVTAPLFAFGGYKVRKFIVTKFPELVGIKITKDDEINIQLKNLQYELKKIEIQNDKLENINQELNAKIAKIETSPPPVVPSPEISPTPTVPPTIITQDKPKIFERKGIIYQFKNCQKSPNINSSTQSISCAILITSTKENVQLRLYSNRNSSARSRLFQQGKEYVATKVKLGTFSSNRSGYVKNSLIKDVPIEAIIDFGGVPLEVNQIDMLQFKSYLESSYYRGYIKTELPNLPVIPEN
ncbi:MULTISPECIES: hypothetical protein [unclassified Moorena]|uniref:hypothetical protein n=1 Tax=unclassified Moorena TaxID=2683338 RepID=UPI0013C669B2|nr:MULTISPECIES: hypothetical protein [unclassified Moorena]NEO20361.1 hypothetical protein [Moorena sp. SIO4A5]NEQ58985.1 hypothetical protein [Moorena sp. SIO4A1]